MNVGTVAAVSDPTIKAWSASTGYSFKYFETLKAALKFFESGGAEAVLAERTDLQPLIKASGGRLAVIAPRDRLRPGVAMALRSEDTDLRFTFEDRIYDMEKDGSMNALTKKWFGIDASEW
jgi:ABC-type amino acid transport substrate-binding protein